MSEEPPNGARCGQEMQSVPGGRFNLQQCCAGRVPEIHLMHHVPSMIAPPPRETTTLSKKQRLTETLTQTTSRSRMAP